MTRIALWLGVVALAATIALVPGPARTEEVKKEKNLNLALKDAVPTILAELRKREGITNVGVLKFLVAENNGMPSDNAGTLGRSLADRLEVALTVGLADNDKLGIIAAASDGVVASDNKRADHRDDEGRKALFSIRPKYFHLAWKPKDEDGVKPDAFLTGQATLSKDRRAVTVEVQLVERKGLTSLCKFTADSDARTFTDLGLTYATTGAKRGVDESELLAMLDKSAPTTDDNAEKLREKAKATLADFDTAPVQLEILYDETPQKVDAEMSEKYSSATLLRVPAPVKGKVKKVSFRLTSRTDDQVGVVLRLNGRNTIFEQRGDPVTCFKWILEKKGQSVMVEGFQIDYMNDQKFNVLSAEESNAAALNYGDSAGLIDVIVFRGVPKPESAVVKNKTADPVAVVIARSAMKLTGQPAASNLENFKKQLTGETVQETDKVGREGGMITKGEKVGASPVKTVEFFPSPYPVSSTTIRYYYPKK